MTEQLHLPHKLTLNGRSELTMTGITEVVSFDEESVIVHTELGTLTVRGQQLQLKTLSTEGGQVAVRGNVEAMFYAQPQAQKDGWLRRLLG